MNRLNRLTRRHFLKTTGAAASWTAAMSILPGCPDTSLTSAAKRKRPNVVLIITDDQGYGDLACHGNGIITTPNLDKLYAESLRLTDFHVSPTCSPTRASLMTGRYCNRTGVWHTIMGRSLLRKDEITMADVFAAAGYRTAIFGKWHLGDSYPFRPHDRGFHEALVHAGGGIGNAQDYWGNDYFDDSYYRNGKPENFEGYCTDVWFAQAMKFIEANRKRPFFCYLATNAPHGPYRVPEKYSAQYGNKGVNANFYGMITNIDENVGLLLSRLDSLALAENTIVIFMTDNGTSAGAFNAEMRGNKGSEYDGGHRVPFFVRWPAGGLGGGVDVPRLTAHIDILPTLIELCGLHRPENVKLDGKSLVPLFGAAANWPDRTIIVDSQRVEDPQKWRKSAVMTDQWRLVNGKELYDMKTDPGQKTDAAQEYPEVVAQLRRQYEKWWADISVRFDEYCEIIVGSDGEEPSKLTSHDWHADGPWNQTQILQAVVNNGFWAVEVARDGEYEIALRRWPAEVDAAINAVIPGGKAINAKTARLTIAELDISKPVPENAAAVTFKAKLKAGKTKLQTWFTDPAGQSRGAYYVYVRRLA